MPRQARAITRLSFYGPTEYGSGHVLSYKDMISAPSDYRPSLLSSLSFIHTLLDQLVEQGVRPGAEVQITISEVDDYEN